MNTPPDEKGGSVADLFVPAPSGYLDAAEAVFSIATERSSGAEEAQLWRRIASRLTAAAAEDLFVPAPSGFGDPLHSTLRECRDGQGGAEGLWLRVCPQKAPSFTFLRGPAGTSSNAAQRRT